MSEPVSDASQGESGAGEGEGAVGDAKPEGDAPTQAAPASAAEGDAREGAATKDGAYAAARASWSFPRFAESFPRDEALDALVVAFTRGDHGAVRTRASELARAAQSEAVRKAAAQLAAAVEPDPMAKVLVLFAAALLVFLTSWWVTHDGPRPERPAPQPVPTVERIK